MERLLSRSALKNESKKSAAIFTEGWGFFGHGNVSRLAPKDVQENCTADQGDLPPQHAQRRL